MPCGGLYVGTVEMVDGEAIWHGSGVCNYENGDRYTGQWRQGMKHGWGKMEWGAGGAYEGAWMEGAMDASKAACACPTAFWSPQRFSVAAKTPSQPTVSHTRSFQAAGPQQNADDGGTGGFWRVESAETQGGKGLVGQQVAKAAGARDSGLARPLRDGGSVSSVVRNAATLAGARIPLGVLRSSAVNVDSSVRAGRRTAVVRMQKVGAKEVRTQQQQRDSEAATMRSQDERKSVTLPPTRGSSNARLFDQSSNAGLFDQCTPERCSFESLPCPEPKSHVTGGDDAEAFRGLMDGLAWAVSDVGDAFDALIRSVGGVSDGSHWQVGHPFVGVSSPGNQQWACIWGVGVYKGCGRVSAEECV